MRDGSRFGKLFQSTLPARGATPDIIFAGAYNVISIHAPRTGSDRAFLRKSAEIGISIHAPRTGSDVCWITFSTRNCQFQSTLPARGATAAGGFLHYMHNHFNPRSLHGERPGWATTRRERSDFNPRSLHGERLVQKRIHRPCTGSDADLTDEIRRAADISIHAPCTGSDTFDCCIAIGHFAFQSTLPARGATGLCANNVLTFAFQSTLPARGAT